MKICHKKSRRNIMVNLKEKPYYLNDRQIQWVEDTIVLLIS